MDWLSKKKPQTAAEETEAQPQAVQSQPVQAPPAALHTLALPTDHALLQLWRNYCEKGAGCPQPELCLEGPEWTGAPLPEPEAGRELSRLQTAVNTSANTRLKSLRPPKAAGKTDKPEEELPPDLDAQAAVFVSGDGLTAWLLVYPPSGQGRELNREMLTSALEGKRVTFGVDQALLDRLPQDPLRYFHLFPAARGEASVPGTDGAIEDLFSRDQERKLIVDEHNRVDYMNLDFVHNAAQGDAICKIIQPTQGQPGRTVQDQPIPARDGAPAVVPKGRNTEVSEDGSALVASIAGHVEFDGRTFQIKPLLEISGNVDYSTGNLNFLGDICIHGDVCSGFSVRAMGSVTIDGVVEACKIEAGGDLVVGKGIQGDNQAIIRSGRNVFAKYEENSCIYVKETLQTDCLINCEVYSGGGVVVRSGRMTIMGGRIRAAREVSAGVIGSRSECYTGVVLGGQPCREYDYDMLNREIATLEIELEAAKHEPESPDKHNRMGKMRMQLTINRKKLEELDREEKKAARMTAASGHRMVCDTVYAGTVLTINEVAYRFEQTIFPCTATLVNGEICLT